MSRPSWFVCEKCLFFEDYKTDSFCRHDTQRVEQWADNYCSNWTCKNCWQGWNDWNWDEKKDLEMRINHSECKKVEFK